MSTLYEEGDLVWVASTFRPGKVVHRHMIIPTDLCEPYQKVYLFGIHEYQCIRESDLVLHTPDILTRAESMIADRSLQSALKELKSDLSQMMEAGYPFLPVSSYMASDNGVEDESAMGISLDGPFMSWADKPFLSPTNTGHGKKRKVLDLLDDEDFLNQPSTSSYVPVYRSGGKLITNDDSSIFNIPETLPQKIFSSPTSTHSKEDGSPDKKSLDKENGDQDIDNTASTSYAYEFEEYHPAFYNNIDDLTSVREVSKSAAILDNGQINANATSDDDCIATSSTAQPLEESVSFSLDISPAAENSESSDNCSVLSGEESDGSLIMNQKFSDLAETIINNSSKRLENGPDTIRATTKEIGFLGLGDMGSVIVYNLLNSGHFITVYNRSPEKCEEFLEDGAEKAEFPSDLIKNCDITFCCLSDENNAINSVFEGDNGLLEGFKQCKGKKRGLVMLTTLDPFKSAELSEKVSEIGGKYLEAPMIGSKKLAQEISLTLICAGDSGLFEDCVTCFASTSRDVIYVGGYVGRANQVKAALGVITGAANVALREAASLVCRKGLPIPMIQQCIVNSPLSCPAILNKVSDFMTNKTETDTEIKSHQKDLHVATSLADHHCLPVPLTASLKEFYLHAKQYVQQSKEGMQIQKD